MKNDRETAQAFIDSCKGDQPVFVPITLAGQMVVYADKFADQETAPLKIENGRMSDTINALIRSGSEKDTEISRLKRRLADCERKRLTGERI